MSDEKSPEVDPRFDPAFQRGFDPKIPIAESVPPPVQRATVAAPPAVAPAAAPARQPIPRAEPVVPARTAAAPLTRPSVPATESAASAAPEDVEGTTDEPIADASHQVASSRNPFLLFLGIIAVALIASGIWLFVRSGDAFNSKVVRSQGDYMSLTATINMAPFIALLGAATAIGVLFVFAAKYRGRRPH